MLTSRTHAAIDYGVVMGLAGIAAMPLASRRVRWAAAATAVVQAGYVSLTDYEGGLAPKLPLQRHRGLDAVGGALLGVLGARLRSPALLAASAGVLGGALLGDVHSCGAPSMVYPPLDTPKRFAPDVWLVDSEIGPGIPVRMTVIRLEDGGLLLHSPTRYSDGLRRSLEAIGPIRTLVAPNSAHWVFAKGWQDAMPGLMTYAAPGLQRRGQVRRSGLRIDGELSDVAPEEWRGTIEQVVVPGGAGFREVAMFHRPSRTLLMTDLVQNFEPAKLPWVLRPVAWALGNTTCRSRAPAHLRLVTLMRWSDAATAARRILGWSPERIVVTHGRPIETGAADRLRGSLGWLTG